MKLGILGDGQLAQMMAKAARPIGIATELLPNTLLGDRAALTEFFKKTTHITFENEFIDVELMDSLLHSNPSFITVFPALDSIATLQNKIKQKRLLQKLEIPSAKAVFSPILIEQVDFARSVFKWATFGYDGKGTLISPTSKTEVEIFTEKARERNTEIFVEEKVAFTQELAMVGVRSQKGDFKNYPLVISNQKKGICDTVYGPAIEFGIPEETENEAQSAVRKIAEELGYVGVIAVEFFFSADGKLLVNEIAPRVHNTGHYTLTAAGRGSKPLCSQFENHVRAVMGLDLGSTETRGLFAMKNIIGLDPDQSPFKNEPGFLNYHKGEVRSGRKMGHVTFVGEDSNFKQFAKSLFTQ